MKRMLLLLVLCVCLWSRSTAWCDEIHDAALAGDLPKVQALIDKDSGLLTAKGQRGKLPIHWAAQGGRLNVVEFLLGKGAAIDSRNDVGETPLVYAADRGHLDLAKFLIAKGAAVNAVTLSGSRPLNYAFNTDSVEIVRLLIENGADVNSAEKYGGRPLDQAYDTGNEALIALMKSKGAVATALDFDTVNLASGLHRLAYPWGMRNNLVVFDGPDGLLVVDTGFSKHAVGAIRQAVSGFAKGDIRYVINTHDHWDHVAGNALAPSAAAVIDSARLTSTDLQSILTLSQKPLSGRFGKTLDRHYEMQFNGQPILLIPNPGLHSAADLLIYFPKCNVVCLGDLLLSQSCPAVGEAAKYLELLDRVLDVFPAGTVFVSGHGRELTDRELKKYRDDLVAMAEIVKKGYAAKKSAEEMIRADVLKAFKPDYSQLDWLGPDSWLRTVVRNLTAGDVKK